MSVLRGDVVEVLRELADFLDEERANVERRHAGISKRGGGTR